MKILKKIKTFFNDLLNILRDIKNYFLWETILIIMGITVGVIIGDTIFKLIIIINHTYDSIKG